jgi:deoxyribodipyrimidine photo-lyase
VAVKSCRLQLYSRLFLCLTSIVFNSSFQAVKFDKDATYIKQWVPELKGCSAKEAIDPAKEMGKGVLDVGYVEPLIDHNFAQKRAVSVFSRLNIK